MRPADTTRTLAHECKPENQSRLILCRQDSLSAHSFSSSLHSIFVLNFDEPYRYRLAITLRQLRYELFVPEEHSISIYNLRDQLFQEADFILFDLTNLNHDKVWLPLRRICRLRKQNGMPLMVHCFSRIYRGPEFQLLVEKLGVRLAYYAE